MENPTGFLPNQVNLTEMKDITVKIVLLGDGMSGKTQLLLTFGNLVLNYLYKIYRRIYISSKRTNIVGRTENERNKID